MKQLPYDELRNGKPAPHKHKLRLKDFLKTSLKKANILEKEYEPTMSDVVEDIIDKSATEWKRKGVQALGDDHNISDDGDNNAVAAAAAEEGAEEEGEGRGMRRKRKRRKGKEKEEEEEEEEKGEEETWC
ncbi:Hypothetical predicted protein [Octopus vulgaris]|uniref:Uncharacterized protein n=1 Tax=Octopus vulgaris TaxID=6645 RepID=A0AA36B2D2_OCTVU|nr:Hypothetical predicted protein [Octopus vulgaris]